MHDGRLYVVGGYADGNRETKGLFRYDPRSDRWTRLRPMPTARAALTAGVIGGRLYAAGGAVNGKALRTLEIYDFRTGRWSNGPPMRVAREHLGGAVSGTRSTCSPAARRRRQLHRRRALRAVSQPLAAVAGHVESRAAAPRRRPCSTAGS